MAYTFNDAKAPDRRKSQLFELVSNRAIYQNGWMACSMAYLPWSAVRTGYENGCAVPAGNRQPK
jgi:arylsulfatase